MRFNPKAKHNPARIIQGYWMSVEIRSHSSPVIFPDWSSAWVSFKKNKRRKERMNSCSLFREKSRQYAKQQRIKNSELVKKRKAEWQKSLSPEKRRESYLRYWNKNKEAIRARSREKARSPEQKEKTRAAEKKRMEKPCYKIRKNLSRSLSSICSRQGHSRYGSILDYLGCSVDQFRNHLESQFKRGMSWSNYGTAWHIDHIIPCAAFDHSNPKYVAQCWHWTNLRPLYASENMFKSDKIIDPQLMLMVSA
jgi:hypothetical protein